MIDIKKELKEKVTKFSNKEYLNGYINKEYLTDDGDADIFLRLRDKYELFDYRTVKDQIEVNKSIYSFIDDKSSMLDNNIQVNLHILGLDLDEHDQGKVKHIIKEHYAIELYKIQKKYREIKYITTLMILFGLLMLASYWLIYVRIKSTFLLEVFGFLFSFSLWKAFENILYIMKDLKFDSECIAQKIIMNVQFGEEE